MKIAFAAIVSFFAAAANAAAADDSAPPVVAAFGDSLSSGYDLPADDGFAPALQRALARRGAAATVINHGVAGETTADGLLRVDWMLADQPDIVVVEFGANDMFRNFPPAVTRDNLDAMLAKIKASGARVVVAGMLAPLNSGKTFADEFNSIFPDLAKKHDAALYPFFLQGVAQDPALNLPDGLHPNAKGVEVIAENIAPVVLQAMRMQPPQTGESPQ